MHFASAILLATTAAAASVPQHGPLSIKGDHNFPSSHHRASLAETPSADSKRGGDDQTAKMAMLPNPSKAEDPALRIIGDDDMEGGHPLSMGTLPVDITLPALQGTHGKRTDDNAEAEESRRVGDMTEKELYALVSEMVFSLHKYRPEYEYEYEYDDEDNNNNATTTTISINPNATEKGKKEKKKSHEDDHSLYRRRVPFDVLLEETHKMTKEWMGNGGCLKPCTILEEEMHDLKDIASYDLPKGGWIDRGDNGLGWNNL